jgi:hypothetical protein
MSDKNKTNAAGVFAKNPELTELFFTNDGQCFSKRGPAMVHQKEIGAAEDGIEVVKREDVVDSPEVSKSESPEEVIVEKPKAKGKKKETE